MRTILVTGGAGYIGSHIVEQLALHGDRVIILDALVYGQSWPTRALPIHASGSVQAESVQAGPVQPMAGSGGDVLCIHGSCGDAALLDTLFSDYTIDAVVHCAALIEVGASVKEPLSFYNTNVSQTLILLDCMKKYGIKNIVFSSSAAVYGNSGVELIAETSSCEPLNPYGQSKLFIERVLADCARAYGLRSVVLRYFNVAGAYAEKGLGERHTPETHVVPLLIKAAVEGASFNLYSADYGTSDGTCIRDYVHVRDIARANVLALDFLCKKSGVVVNFEEKPLIANIGSEKGISVLQLVGLVEATVGKKIATQVVERRAGDGAFLVADATRAKTILGWIPCFSLTEALKDAYLFHKQCDYSEIVSRAIQGNAMQSLR